MQFAQYPFIFPSDSIVILGSSLIGGVQTVQHIIDPGLEYIKFKSDRYSATLVFKL